VSAGRSVPGSTARPSRAPRPGRLPGQHDGAHTVPARCDTAGRRLPGREPPAARAPCPAWVRARPHRDTGPVGFNPFRQHRRSAADIAMVAGALIVCALLVAWAAFG